MVEAVIFDLDGVISDTQSLHAKVDSQILSKFGIDLHPDEITLRYAGVGDRAMFANAFAEHNVKTSIDSAINQKWLLMTEYFKQDAPKPISFSIELVHLLKEAKLKLAIGSGSPKHFISTVLELFSLHEYFDSSVSAHEVACPKPAADVFLEAATRIGIAPRNCIVIEDGISGMEAARAAGMGCIGLVQDSHKEYPADVVVRSLMDITLQLIEDVHGSALRKNNHSLCCK